MDIAIIGIGTWGLCVLERIVAWSKAAKSAARPMTVYVIEPADPGVGIHTTDQPEYLLLNTVCGQVSMFPGREFQHGAPGIGGPGLFEWLRSQQQYRWNPGRGIGQHRRELSPHDFVPRRWCGEYLRWVYLRLVESAADDVCIRHVSSRAVDIVASSCGREEVILETGGSLFAHHIFLTTGHTENLPSEEELPEQELLSSGILLDPYPVGKYVESIPPGKVVGVSGMGLVAIDVITSLTTGRGGEYAVDSRTSHRRYVPSGREPKLIVFSRSGAPCASRPATSEDLSGTYQPPSAPPPRSGSW